MLIACIPENLYFCSDPIRFPLLMPLQIRILQDHEYPTANDFINRTEHLNGPSKKRTRRYHEFRWEYLDAPDRKVLFAAAWDMEDGKVPVLVGLQGMIIHSLFSPDGNSIRTAKGEDTLIDMPALRKFMKIDILRELADLLVAECRRLGVECLWGLNALPATWRRLGYETPFRSFNSILVLDPVKACRSILALRSEHSLFGKFRMGVLSMISYLYQLRRMLISPLPQRYHLNAEIRENTGLFKKASGNGKLFFLKQDAEYVQWRVRRNPYPVTYRSFQLLDQDDNLLAQVICSHMDHSDSAFIEQALFDRELDRKVILSFLGAVINRLQKENVILVRYMGFQNNDLKKMELKLFKQVGFVLTGNGEWFTFKMLSENSAITPGCFYLSRLYQQGRT
jgi:hypothetical protein